MHVQISVYSHQNKAYIIPSYLLFAKMKLINASLIKWHLGIFFDCRVMILSHFISFYRRMAGLHRIILHVFFHESCQITSRYSDEILVARQKKLKLRPRLSPSLSRHGIYPLQRCSRSYGSSGIIVRDYQSWKISGPKCLVFKPCRTSNRNTRSFARCLASRDPLVGPCRSSHTATLDVRFYGFTFTAINEAALLYVVNVTMLREEEAGAFLYQVKPCAGRKHQNCNLNVPKFLFGSHL